MIWQMCWKNWWKIPSYYNWCVEQLGDCVYIENVFCIGPFQCRWRSGYKKLEPFLEHFT